MESVFQLGEGTRWNTRKWNARPSAKNAATEGIVELVYDKIPRQTLNTERKEKK